MSGEREIQELMQKGLKELQVLKVGRSLSLSYGLVGPKASDGDRAGDCGGAASDSQ